MPYLTNDYANPSSIYTCGNSIREVIENSRKRIAQILNAKPKEIYFTGSGTESINWAIKSTAEITGKKHIITTQIEHHAVLNTCKYLENCGYDITYLPVDHKGIVSPSSVSDAMRKDTSLISIMLSNNETGTIQPIKQISDIAKLYKIPFHTDAVQAVGHMPVNVNDLGVDLLSLSGHKFNAPKGIGVLYIKSGIQLSPLLHGGHQERNKRAGTENVASIVGIATALDIAFSEINKESIRQSILLDKLTILKQH